VDRLVSGVGSQEDTKNTESISVTCCSSVNETHKLPLICFD
jgi:hypothetical protein